MRILTAIFFAFWLTEPSQAQIIFRGETVEIPFSEIRSHLPPDRKEIDLKAFRKADVFPNEKGDDKNEWFQLALGKVLKARLADRNEKNEVSLGDGVSLQDGFIVIRAGWRARRAGPETHFDGTFVAKINAVMTQGNWIAKLSEVEAKWNTLIPMTDGPVSSKAKEAITPWVENELKSVLNDVTKTHLATICKKYGLNSEQLLRDLSGTFTGTGLVLRLGAKAIDPLHAGKKVIDERGDKKRTIPAGNYNRIEFDEINRSEVDGTSAVAISAIEVKGEINGQSIVRLVAAPGATVKIYGQINGQSNVYINAPDGYVEFHGEINGQSHVHVTAKQVTFFKKIDGDRNNGRITEVHLSLGNGGSASVSELYAHLYWRWFADPRDPKNPPRPPVPAKCGWAWKIEEVRP